MARSPESRQRASRRVSRQAGQSERQRLAVPRIGHLLLGTPEREFRITNALQEGLRERGWVDGANVLILRRYANGAPHELQGLVAELVELPVDVIVAAGTAPARAAKQATDTIPVVMAGGDPLGSGLIQSFQRPGGNVTGVAAIPPERSAEHLERLKQAIPRASRVACLWNTTSRGHTGSVACMRTAAESLGITLVPLAVDDSESLLRALDRLGVEPYDAVVVLGGPLMGRFRNEILDFASASRLPMLHVSLASVDAGGLMGYALDTTDLHRRSVSAYVDKILRGASPADLPVEQPTRLEFVVNLRTARSLGLDIAQSVLARADRLVH